MAASKNSRWGWMSQAVASVESGLDRILAEDEEPPKDTVKPVTAIEQNATPKRSSSDISRIENSKTNDRLQARLAQAMAKKTPSRSNTPQPVENTAASDGVMNGQALFGSQRSSLDIAATKKEPLPLESLPTQVVSTGHSPAEAGSSRPSGEVMARQAEEKPPIPLSKASREQQLNAEPIGNSSAQDPRALAMQLDHEKSMADVQEEINGYLERIDAMQRNLQILTKETIQNAKSTKSDAITSSQQKKLAEKDEKIALLIEEGSKLAKSELQFRNTIKKLRLETVSLTKDQDTLRLRLEKAEQATASSEDRVRRTEAEVLSVRSQLSELNKSSTDLDAITKERNALSATVAEIRGQLSRANKRAEEAESQAQSDKIEVERRKVSELENNVTNIKDELQREREKSRKVIEDLKQRLTAEKEQVRVMETEMLAERAALESKLEAFRLRAEEVSSCDQNDSQAKLLRQIEALQSQYNTASQNWQGIESTLLSRITTIEEERDDAVSREAELRRKLRDATGKAKAATKELDDIRQVLNTLQEKADQQEQQQRVSQKQILTLETEAKNLHKALAQQKVYSETDMAKKLEEERIKWMTSLPQSTPRVESPVASMRRGQQPPFMDTISSPLERPMSRRSSAHPFPDSNYAHSRLNSTTSIKPTGLSPPVETPSIVVPEDQDDFFANVPATPASMTRVDSDGRLNEVISASTAGAGPSVQLVERLSTTVRRLETEKAASKDELHRLSTQRDEARKEVVNLMREVEQKRAAEERLAEIEAKYRELSTKYEKTLELLGEKSEQVEELKADIADVKDMYRHLADTMGK